MSRTRQLGYLAIVAIVVLALSAAFASLAQAQSSSSTSTGTTTKSYVFDAHLSPANEVPPITGTTTGTSTGTTTGHVRVWFDFVNPATTSAATSSHATGTLQNMMQVAHIWNGNDITMGHLHCGAAGQIGPVVLDLFHFATGTDVNGTVVGTSTVQSSNLRATTTGCATPITTLSELAQAMISGQIYANVHSVQFPSGVARGQMMLTSSSSTTTPPMGTTTPPHGTTTPPHPTTTPPFPGSGLGSSITALIRSIMDQLQDTIQEIIRDLPTRSLRLDRIR